MGGKIYIEPDLDFIRKIIDQGGGGLKKCVQCATCSVVCAIAPDNKPYPRKEMIAASWGLKDMLVGNHDIWLCHNCGDCSTLCPRKANPGDVLSAIRSYAIREYAKPGAVGELVNNPRKLPILFGIPTVLFIIVGLLTGLLDFTPSGDKIVHSHFFSHWLVELFFVPLMFWVLIVFGMGIRRFIRDIHKNALQAGKTDKKRIEIKGFLQAFLQVAPEILKHKKFTNCSENKKRGRSHMMVFFSFVALAVVAVLFGSALHLLGFAGPYSQANPLKVVANVAGIFLVAGSTLMILERRKTADQVSSYTDMLFLWLLFGIGLTGILVEITRLTDAAFFSYLLYFVHLVLAFNLVGFMPFTKLAHLSYRTIALAYDKYIERKYSA